MKKSMLVMGIVLAGASGLTVADSLFVDSTGFVGVGTNTPGALLHTFSADAAEPYPVTFLTENSVGPSALFRFTTTDPTVASIDFNKVNDKFRLNLVDGDAWELQLAASGDLTIKGSLITAAGTYPDYVFKDEYKLMPIGDLASFIEKEGHLPNVQSEADVKAQGGVNISQLQTQMLEKIEQLTLYTIEQHNQIEQLQARLDSMEK